MINKEYKNIIFKIRNSRNILNIILFFEKFINNLLISGIVLFLSFFTLKYLFNFEIFDFKKLIIFSSLLSFLLSFTKLKVFFNLKKTAFYIDQKFKLNNIFSALLYCNENNLTGIIQNTILNKTKKSLNFKIYKIINFSNIFKKCLILIALFFIYFLFFNYFIFKYSNPEQKILSTAENISKDEKSLIQSPETISKILAGNDLKLKKEIQNAILNKDFDALKKAIEKSENNFSKRLAKMKDSDTNQMHNQISLRNELINYLLNDYKKNLNSIHAFKSEELSKDTILAKNQNTAEKDKENPANKNILEKVLNIFNNTIDKTDAKGKISKKSDLNDSLSEIDEENDESSEDGSGLGLSSGKPKTVKVPDKKIGNKLYLSSKKDEKLSEKILIDKNPEMMKKQFILNQETSDNNNIKKNLIPAAYKNFIRNYFIKINNYNNKEKTNEK